MNRIHRSLHEFPVFIVNGQQGKAFNSQLAGFMTPEAIIHKANSIYLYFKSYGDEKAVEGIKDHLEKFWEPRMLKQINDYVQQGGEGLDKLVIKAVQQMSSK